MSHAVAELALAPENAWRVRLRRYLPAAILFVLALGLWETLTTVLQVETFLLPKPSLIAATFVQEAPIALRASLFTMRNAVGGFFIGSALAIIIALTTARWTAVSEGMMPLAIAVNATPIVALAPIMNQWFGVTDPLSKMSIVAVMVFFPVMINMVRGLTTVEASALELMRSYASNEFETLWQVRIPNSLPYLFGAFKVASTLSIIGAIVSEYFGGLGPKDALGAYIAQQASDFRFASAWAAIIVACLAGILFYGVILFVERWLMPWHVSLRVADTE
jgi:NitT/TauT family transport system permease protein